MWKTVVLIFCQIIGLLADYTVPPPNLGDVRIENPTVDNNKNPVEVFGNAQVFFSDGGLSPPQWSYICFDIFRNPEAKVFCKQLGYLNGRSHRSSPSNTGNYPTWLKNVTCHAPVSYSHILHCKFAFKQNSTACGGADIAGVTCTNPMIQDKSSTYQGQPIICPPDSMDGYQEYRNVSASMGIVGLKFYSEWGGIAVKNTVNPSQEITQYHGDLICHEIGFQQMVPGSVQSLSSILKYSSYTFDGCTERSGGPQISHAWITSDDFFCKNKIYDGGSSAADDPCFGCCYSYPDEHKVSKVDLNFIVIQCMYNPYVDVGIYVPYGNESACSFGSGAKTGENITKFNSVCAADQPSRASVATIIVAPIISVLTIVIIGLILLLLIICCCCRKTIEDLWKNRSKKKSYGSIDGNRGENRNENQVPNQND